MTSRVSFPKLFLATLKQHLAIILFSVLTFIIHVIAFFIEVQNTITSYTIAEYTSSYFPQPSNTERIAENILELCTPNVFSGFMAFGIGIILAFDFFRYLHSKRETDFYESLPIRKKKRFLTIIAICSCFFMILTVLMIGIETAIVFGSGYGSSLIVRNMFWNLLCMLGAFAVGFVATAFVMTITGHTIIAVLGFGAVCIYIPVIIGYLFPVYAVTFFETYISKDLPTAYYFFSPATLVYKMVNYWNEWKLSEHWMYIVGCFGFALLLGIITYLLFIRRPSEAAGRAMAFEKVNFIIRFILVIPLSLYLGALLLSISSVASFVWMLFGILFGTFLLHGIFEAIFQFDIKALLTKKKQLLISMAFSLAFLSVFFFDMFGYDKYMPKESELKSVVIDTYLFDFHEKMENSDWQDGLTGAYIDDALKAIQDIRKTSYKEGQNFNYANNFEVTYVLKNGMKHQRCYQYYGETFPKSLDLLYATEEFKNDFCILYHLDQSEITSVNVSNGPEYHKFQLSKNEMDAFFETYVKEFTAITFTETLTTPCVFELVIGHSKNGTNMSQSYPVYASFTEIIEIIKKSGIDSFAESDKINLVNLEIYGNKYNDDRQYVSDPKVLQELRPHLILEQYLHERYDEYLYGSLRYEFDNETRYTNVYIKEEILNQILKE